MPSNGTQRRHFIIAELEVANGKIGHGILTVRAGRRRNHDTLLVDPAQCDLGGGGVVVAGNLGNARVGKVDAPQRRVRLVRDLVLLAVLDRGVVSSHVVQW